MAKPTYEELFKSYMRCEEDREELILENDCLHDIINKAIEYIEDLLKYNEVGITMDNMERDRLEVLLDILKGSDSND